jgi:hypothetical protein
MPEVGTTITRGWRVPDAKFRLTIAAGHSSTSRTSGISSVAACVVAALEVIDPPSASNRCTGITCRACAAR